MPGIEIGTVCIKTRGRKAGKKVVIIDIDEKTGLAIVDGKEVKRKKCNLKHLIPTKEKIEVKKNASHEEVVKKLSD